MKKMSSKKYKKLLLEEGLDVYDLIDEVIEINGFIGVGIIRLGDSLKDYCYNKLRRK